MMLPAKYYGKIILFGEYTILKGGTGFVIPYSNVFGFFDYLDPASSPKQHQSNADLQNFLKYLQNIEGINIQAFEKDLKKGLFFKSNIPSGYGVGSSGALVAGVFERYCLNKHTLQSDLTESKKYLAKMESFFHGTSSGIDPLCCFIQKPLMFRGPEIIVFDKVSTERTGLFLLDSGQKRSTDDFIKIFTKKCKDEKFCKIIDEQLMKSNLECVNNFNLRDNPKLKENFEIISRIQYEQFNEMIPTHIQPLWIRGLETGQFYLKLCGSGGGGYMIGLSSVAKEKLEVDFPLIWLS